MNTYARGSVIRPMAEALLRHRRAEDEVIKHARRLADVDPLLSEAVRELGLAEKALTPQHR